MDSCKFERASFKSEISLIVTDNLRQILYFLSIFFNLMHSVINKHKDTTIKALTNFEEIFN